MAKWRTKPAKYNNAAEMQVIIDEYFKDCEESGEVASVTGLAYVLDLTRQGILDYENCVETGKLKSLDDSVKVEISDSIKRAKKYIESRYEQTLYSPGKTVGAIFTLKNNYKWVDKQEIEQTSKTITVELED